MITKASIRIDASALIANIRSLKTIVPGQSEFVAVLKGNAYGHGLREVFLATKDEVEVVQFDDLAELATMRTIESELGLFPKRALVLGYVPSANLESALDLEAEITIYDLDRARKLSAIAASSNRIAKVHLKVDALLGRQGVMANEFPEFYGEVSCLPGLKVAGIYSHFANIEDTPDTTHASAQIQSFRTAVSQANARHFPTHLAATSGLMVEEGRSAAGDLVRIGIGLYGIYPSAALARSFEHLQLKPILSWATQLAMVKQLPSGHPIGYGLTFVTRRPMRIGIVPQGYADGYDRGLSNTGQVLIGGQRCPVLGRIAMNMFAVDLEAVPWAQAEDEVILIGPQNSERIGAEEVSTLLGTIPYEVLARISPLIPRVIN